MTYKKFTILAQPFLVIITIYKFVWTMSGRVEKKIIYRNNAFSLYDLYGHTLAQEPLPRGSWILVDPCLVIITIHTWFVSSMPGSREGVFWKNYSFSLCNIWPCPAQEPLPWRSWILFRSNYIFRKVTL